MNVKTNQLGKNIRKARQERNITQEELAKSLYVSESAVSQWESGKTSPDLGIIPELCAALDVSADWLLDVGTEKRQKEIEEICKRAGAFSDAGQEEKAAEILEEGLEKYPSSDMLVYNLLYNTWNSDKVIKLGEWLLKNSKNDEYRHGAVQCLVYAYSDKGESQKAEDLARKMPNIPSCRDALLCRVLTGENRIRHIQNYRKSLLEFLIFEIFDSNSDDLLAARKSIAILELMFENGDYGFFNECLCESHCILAKHSALAHDKDSTLHNLSQAADHAFAFVNYVENPSFKHSSLLFSELPADRVLMNSTDNTAKCLLDSINDPVFDFVKGTEDFRKIAARLNTVAGKWVVKQSEK